MEELRNALPLKGEADEHDRHSDVRLRVLQADQER